MAESPAQCVGVVDERRRNALQSIELTVREP
jgi:hypothetical protein